MKFSFFGFTFFPPHRTKKNPQTKTKNKIIRKKQKKKEPTKKNENPHPAPTPYADGDVVPAAGDQLVGEIGPDDAGADDHDAG